MKIEITKDFESTPIKFTGTAYKVESTYKRETQLQSDSLQEDESYVDFVLSSTYGELKEGVTYRVTIEEVKDKQ
jgi:hypothetical protein